MPVPKRKRSRSRRDKRFANKGFEANPFSGCTQCNEPLASHSACQSCGYYKGRKIMVGKKERAERRKAASKAKKRSMKGPSQEPVESPKEA